MYDLQTYLGHFSGFVTIWVTNSSIMFARQIGGEEVKVTRELRRFVPKGSR